MLVQCQRLETCVDLVLIGCSGLIWRAGIARRPRGLQQQGKAGSKLLAKLNLPPVQRLRFPGEDDYLVLGCLLASKRCASLANHIPTAITIRQMNTTSHALCSMAARIAKNCKAPAHQRNGLIFE